jgi:hypothetical protein
VRQVRITHANWVSDWLAGDAGATRWLTDEQAYEAVDVYNLAVYIDGSTASPPPPPPVAEPVLEIEPSVSAEDLVDHIEAVADGYPQDSPLAQRDTALRMPWSNASKAAWIDWAVHLGADPEQAAGLTKNELMSRYGERL